MTNPQLTTDAIYTQDEAFQIGHTIRSQINAGVLMCLGAHRLAAGNIPATPGTTAAVNGPRVNPGLRFHARILPFRADGTRSRRPRIMTIDITLNGLDLYDIVVHYPTTRTRQPVIHHHSHNVYAEDLTPELLALDSDHDRTTA